MTAARPAARSIWAAMAVIYVVWGSTYLGIRLMIDTLPPFLSGSTRFLTAGLILGTFALASGQLRRESVSRRQWLNAAISGALLMGGGNGAVTLAEQRIPTGLTALIVSVSPLIVALILLVGFQERLRGRAWIGLFIGLAGLFLLVRPEGGGQHLDPLGLAAALASPVLWSAGSVWTSRTAMPGAVLGSAAQMVSGGAVLALAGVAFGEPSHFHPEQVAAHSVLALLYLIGFGSLLAFSAFAWLLRVVSVSLVATSAYVNPVVAVLLGFLVLREQVTAIEAAGGVVIVAAVALIVSAPEVRRPAPM